MGVPHHLRLESVARWRFPTTKSIWLWEWKPSLRVFSNLILLDSQQEQPFLGSSIKHAAAASDGAGELYGARGRHCFIVCIFIVKPPACSYTSLYFSGERVAVW